MSYWTKNEDEEDEDDEEEFSNITDKIIFLVDARRSMMEVNSKAECHLKNCLRVLCEVMKNKIVAQDKSSIGLIFFGTKEKINTESAENVFTMFELGPPSAERIRKLKGMIENIRIFEKSIGSQDLNESSTLPCPLKQALWACSTAFSGKDIKTTDSKRIWLFTNDDNPNSHSSVDQKAIVTVARDLAQNQIEISLFHLNKANQLFNPKTFYTQILVAESETQDDEDDSGNFDSAIDHRMMDGGYDGFDSLIATVRKKEFRKRRLGHTCFSLVYPLQNETPRQHMAVHIYKMIQLMKKPYHTWLDGATSEPLKSVTSYFNESTGEIIPEENISTYVEVGSERVFYSKSEMKAFRTLGNLDGVGIQLLSFVNRGDLFEDLVMETPYFVYPDEKSVKGSNALFESLLRQCFKKKVLPIVRFNLTISSAGRLAAMIPQMEEIDEDGCQILPPGFHLFYLPFTNDIRFNPIEEQLQAVQVDKMPEEVKSLAKEIVGTFTLPEEFCFYKDINSPSLQNFYSVLQAVALNEEELEWNPHDHDKMQPSAETLELASKLTEKLREVIGFGEDDMVQSSTKTKKRSADSSSSAPAKRTKAAKEQDDGEAEMDDSKIKALVASNKITSLTVADLKTICKYLSQPVSGTKAVLCERIIANCPK